MIWRERFFSIYLLLSQLDDSREVPIGDHVQVFLVFIFLIDIDFNLSNNETTRLKL